MALADSAVFERRVEKLAEGLRSSSVDAVILTHPPNVYYFTGFKGGVLVCGADGTISIFSTTPVTTPLAARAEIIERLGRREALTLAFEYIGDRRISLGYDILPIEAYYTLIKTKPSISLKPIKDFIYELRQVKSSEEVENLRKASAIASTAIDVVREVITYGTTVSDIRRALADYVYRMNGELAFNPQISFGDDTFLNINSDNNRELRKGELIKIRVGVVVNEYVAVLSRTYHYGRNPPEKIVKTYNALISLNEMIKKMSTPWSPAVSIYDRCRAFAIESGLEPSALTAYGGGVGLEEVEPPLIVANSVDIMREDTVLSIGPDYLLQGRYGISVSDIYHVSSSGAEPLTEASRELEIPA